MCCPPIPVVIPKMEFGSNLPEKKGKDENTVASWGISNLNVLLR